MSEPFLFVSHVSEDRAPAAELVSELERRGVFCWIAPRDVRPGKPYDDEIAEAIDGCAAMLLIFSERCNESQYIRREITVAGEAQKLIIPFRIENAQPKRGLRIRLADLHWIDGFIAREQAIDSLVRSVLPRPVIPAGEVAPKREEHIPPAQDKRSSPTDGGSNAIPANPLATSATTRGADAATDDATTLGPSAEAQKSVEAIEAELMKLTEEEVSTEGWSDDDRSALERARRGDAYAQFNIGLSYRAKPLPKDPRRGAGWMLKAAYQNHGQAMMCNGAMYLRAEGVPLNPERSLFWFRKGAERGDSECQFILAMELRDKKTEEDAKEAVLWAKKSADAGNRGGLCLLGEFYENGVGVERDPAQAMTIYRMTLSQPYRIRDTNALFRLGGLYERGIGVDQDLQQAAEWYANAGSNRHAEFALNRLRDSHGVVPKAGPYDKELLPLTQSVVTEGWPVQHRALADAAQRDEPTAQYSMGLLFRDGDQDLPPDATRAAAWLLRAALNGNLQAQIELAEFFRTGRGVPEDLHEAFRWDLKVAEQGDAAAQHRVAQTLDSGLSIGWNFGLKANPAAAIEWYLKAGAQGVGAACERVGELYAMGKGVETDFGQAAAWCRKAYDAGATSLAPMYLGRFYENGEGVEQDLQQAAEWYARAQSPSAKEGLARVMSKQLSASGETQQAS